MTLQAMLVVSKTDHYNKLPKLFTICTSPLGKVDVRKTEASQPKHKDASPLMFTRLLKLSAFKMSVNTSFTHLNNAWKGVLNMYVQQQFYVRCMIKISTRGNILPEILY